MSFKDRLEKSKQQHSKESLERSAAIEALEERVQNIKEKAKAQLLASPGYLEISSALNNTEFLEALNFITQAHNFPSTQWSILDLTNYIDEVSVRQRPGEDLITSYRTFLELINERKLVEGALAKGLTNKMSVDHGRDGGHVFELQIQYLGGKLQFIVNGQTTLESLDDFLNFVAEGLAELHHNLFRYYGYYEN